MKNLTATICLMIAVLFWTTMSIAKADSFVDDDLVKVYGNSAGEEYSRCFENPKTSLQRVWFYGWHAETLVS
jgi:hypothetical protein